MAWIPDITTLGNCIELLLQQGNLVSAQVQKQEQALTITHLSYDSLDIKAGTLFICKGTHFSPEYLVQALQKGAIAYVSEHSYADYLEEAGLQPVPAVLVRTIRSAITEIASLYYRGLLKHLTLIGFTGTKGKSTTTYMLKSILDSWLTAQHKHHSAWLSSIANYDGVELTRSPLTTQEPLELYKHFSNAVACGIEYFTMEVSSQALKYGRTSNLWFEVAAFLNIGEDHISPIEHPNHEDYLSTKLEIFKQCTTAVINSQSDDLERVLKAAEVSKRILQFSSASGSSADIRASHIESTVSGFSFTVHTKHWQEDFAVSMAGRFNVDNALAAITAALALGVPVEHMQRGLAECQVSGRMQLTAGPDDKLIIVDYAHNKLSFETIFATVSAEYPTRSIVVVFGATGTKGEERRRDLPAVAAQYTSMIYITEDDPLEEPLEQINLQIAEVVCEAGAAYTIVEDREAAIERAILESPQGSIVLVLGKGHETVMKRGTQSVPIPSDYERVKKIVERENSLQSRES